MLKKFMAVLISATFLFAVTPVGSFITPHEDHVASAKGYKSGKRSFGGNSSNNGPSLFKKSTPSKKNNSVTNKSAATKSKTGGFMRGMLFGGIAGLLLGGMLGNMGGFGAFLGLMLNILAIVVVISLIRGIFTYFRNKRKEEEARSWRR
ncbi:hypothetical protein [Priestia koreensis]|uniref:hypothetical protein n=1 Tax=Priestia koreensis TaxID=284581 RepID=UPI001F5A91F3|nr:hypothetical protein [Priestia koreensis]UNL86664.1 hypothetical protein IE339_09315 [Priestia koreensis]